jgi:flagellar biosynthesis chaperone FliJ
MSSLQAIVEVLRKSADQAQIMLGRIEKHMAALEKYLRAIEARVDAQLMDTKRARDAHTEALLRDIKQLCVSALDQKGGAL